MHLDLSDDETIALTKELQEITRNERYQFSSRIRTLKAILAQLKPEAVREPPEKHRAPFCSNKWVPPPEGHLKGTLPVLLIRPQVLRAGAR
jgi:hypothetical protein